nr:hypothetical protein [Paenibacillus sp. FSL H7-0331]
MIKHMMVNHHFLKHDSSTIVLLYWMQQFLIRMESLFALRSRKLNEVPVIVVTHNDHQMLESFQAGADDSKQHVKELRHDD